MAANDGLIEGLAPGVLVELQAYNKEIVTAMGNIPKLNDFLKNTKTPAQADGSFKALNDQITKQDELIKKLQLDLIRVSAAQRNLVISTDSVTRATGVGTKSNRDYAVSQQIIRAETDRNFRANTLLAGAYAKASAQLLILKKQAKDYAISLGESHPKTQQAIKDANDLAGRIKSADQSVGDFQRNVGNYSNGVTKGISAIFSGVRQLAYILPGIGIAGIFSLAIDPLWELIKGLGLFNDKFAEMNKNFQNFKETLSNIRTGIRAQREDFRALYELATDPNADGEERNKAVDELKSKYSSFFSEYSDGAIKAGKASEAFSKANKSISAKEIVDQTNEYKRKTEERIDMLQSELQARRDFARKSKELQAEVNKSLNVPTISTGGTGGRGADVTLSPEAKAAQARFDELKRQRAEQIKILKEKKEETVVNSSNAKLEKDIAFLNKQQAQAQDVYNKYLGKSLLLNKEIAGVKGKEREYDADSALLDARTRYLKELSALTNKETENEKQARERRIELLQREAKDETKSYDYRINAYGEFLKLKQDATLKDVAQSIAALEQARIAEQEQSKKSENSDLKRAGAFDPRAAIKNATQIAAIRKYYADEEIVRTQKYAEMELEIERKASNAYLDIVEETAKAEILIEKKRQDILDSTREAERSYQIEIFKKAADNEKLSLEIRQSNFNAYTSTRIAQMEAAKQKELEAAAQNDELTANIIKNFDIQKAKLMGEKSPYEIAAEQAKAAVKSIADSIKSGFLSDAGLGSLTQFFDGSFNKIIEGLDKITDDGERASEKFHAYFQAISESAQEAFNLIMEMSKKTMQQEYDRLEATKNIDIQFAGESDVAKKEIERQYEARKRALQIREAKRAQDLAIINVNINAAQAIIAGYKDGNYVTGTILGVLVTGLAIAQIAAIKSQKLPEYWKGTDNAPAGLAWTQERGAEIITDRQGRIKTLGSDKGAQLTKLDAGDKVFTADKSKDLMNDIYLNRILSERGINQSPAVVNVAAQPAFTQAHVNQIVSAINNQPVPEVFIENGEFRNMLRTNNSRQEIMNARATQKGFSTRG